VNSEQATQLIQRASSGDSDAADRLMPLVLDELKAIAERLFRDESAGHTLQPTALVNEAYLKLLGRSDLSNANRRVFLNAAAEGMRRILIDHARRRSAGKRGGEWKRSARDVSELALSTDPSVVIQLDEAFAALEQDAPEMAAVVRLRLYAGLTADQTADLLAISTPTVSRRWAWSRAWLYRYMSEDDLQ
jgi:RNA polymerase sigma factor (TIGR02999 family)